MTWFAVVNAMRNIKLRQGYPLSYGPYHMVIYSLVHSVWVTYVMVNMVTFIDNIWTRSD